MYSLAFEKPVLISGVVGVISIEFKHRLNERKFWINVDKD